MEELTKEVLVEIKSLEDDIVAKKELIESLYTELGRYTYEKNSLDRDNKLAGIVASLDDINKTIREIEINILDKKGYRVCATCGANVDKSLMYCGECGTRMPVELKTTEDGIVCSQCGTIMKPFFNFCTSCGNKLSANQAEDVKQAEEVKPEIKEITECPSCGKAVKPNATFCINCGTKVR